MDKPVIDAREVLNDLRSGMEDVDLMQKYNLSSRGLQSLFRKLTQAGIIREVSPRELLRDIRAGYSPDRLMEKYKLSVSALRCALRDLDLFGFLDEAKRQGAATTVVKISASEVIADIRAGMGDLRLMEKYGISFDGLQRVYAKLLEGELMTREELHTVRINPSEVVADVRAGMDDMGLMKKYGISSGGLQHLCARLVETGAITQEELHAAASCSEDTIGVDALPQFNRDYPVLSLAAMSFKHIDAVGVIRNISEKEVGVSGIACEVGEPDTLILKGGDALAGEPLLVAVTCKSSKIDDAFLDILSKYEITGIDDSGLKNLREFIRALSVLCGEEK